MGPHGAVVTPLHQHGGLTASPAPPRARARSMEGPGRPPPSPQLLDLRGNQEAWVTEENESPKEDGRDVNPGEYVDTPSLSPVSRYAEDTHPGSRGQHANPGLLTGFIRHLLGHPGVFSMVSRSKLLPFRGFSFLLHKMRN